MNCIICLSNTEYSHAKIFSEYSLGRVDYLRCTKCGFVFSETHYLMSEERFWELDRLHHEYLSSSKDNPEDPGWGRRLNSQAKSLVNHWKEGLIVSDPCWLDFASGNGALADKLEALGSPKVIRHNLSNHDSYSGMKFPLVIATSVLEHMRTWSALSSVKEKVAAGGTLAWHMDIYERVPAQPFHFQTPVHCSFFSHASLDILMSAWGVKEAHYDEEAQLHYWKF